MRWRSDIPEQPSAETSLEQGVADPDAAPARAGRAREPERSCIVTRAKGPPAELLRFGLGPDGVVVPDIRARLPGRGAWVTAEASVVSTAVKRKSFARAFKTEVAVPPDLAALVEGLLERDALQALSLANKAGLVLTGAFKVEAGIGAKSITALVHAAEAGADGRRKLDAALTRQLGDAARMVARIQFFRSDQLDLALGRTNVIHAALAVGSASDGFVSRAQRLARFRTGSVQTGAAMEPNRSIDD